MDNNSSIFFPLSVFNLNSTSEAHYNFFETPDYEIIDEQNKEDQKSERNERTDNSRHS